jgi:hypothetical protein
MKKIISLLLLSTLIASLLISCAPHTFTATVVAAQKAKTQFVTVKMDTKETLKQMEVTVKHGDVTVSQTLFEGEDVLDNTVDAKACYGNVTVLVKAVAENGKINESTNTASLYADEYVLAPISGSMPQLYFTLNIKEITNNGAIPTFVWLARPDSYNWDNLPENVFAMPTVEKSEILTHNNYDRMIEVTDKYIEELYALNPASKFNLYLNDFNNYVYMKLLAGNGIPEENYYVTLLSDGGASYKSFNDAFNSEDTAFDADAKYAEMKTNLETLYTQVREKGDYYYSTTDFAVDTTTFRQYSYVAAKEMTNVEWWILRPRAGVLCSPDEDFINTVLNTDKTEGIIEERNFANPLKAMTDEEKTQLKALYNFNNEMFEAADTQGKKAMMILGSWATAENEPDFEDYANLIKEYYGDEFVYYYKGHPNTPTSNYPEKQAQLEKLGLIDVESSINAELILFFYPDIYMCGYNSSTFMSVESEEMACCMFNMTIEDANKNEGMTEYKDLIGIYASKITADGEYKDLIEDETHTYYLMQFNGEEKIGVYDATANTFKYYSTANGELTKIEQ